MVGGPGPAEKNPKKCKQGERKTRGDFPKWQCTCLRRNIGKYLSKTNVLSLKVNAAYFEINPSFVVGRLPLKVQLAPESYPQASVVLTARHQKRRQLAPVISPPLPSSRQMPESSPTSDGEPRTLPGSDLCAGAGRGPGESAASMSRQRERQAVNSRLDTPRCRPRPRSGRCRTCSAGPCRRVRGQAATPQGGAATRRARHGADGDGGRRSMVLFGFQLSDGNV